MSDSPLTLTLDIGTSSTRVLLWDTQGREVDGVHAQIPYEMHTTPDGGVEMPMEAMLVYVGSCLDLALTQAGDRAQAIRAVGISTFWHSLLGVDAEGIPLTPIYSWADARAGAVAIRLRKDLDAEAIHKRTGCVIHPSYYPAKLVWLRETQPELFYKVKRWISPSEYLFRRWFGPQAMQVSVSMASGTGLFHQENGTWDAETLATLQIPQETLSPIVDLKQSSQGLVTEFAHRWPALREVPFFPAVGDGACGNIGSGCVSPNRLAINLGTSGAIRTVWDEANPSEATQATVPDGLWRYRVDSHRPIIGAAFSDGGHVYAYLTHVLQLPQGDDLQKQLAAMEPGEHGLTFLPFLAGERSMGWNPDARASLVGLNLDTEPVEILRCAMEAVALRFALAARSLHQLFPQANQILASGGALGHSPAWSQIFADALGQPITLAAEAEASSRGAALLAMEATGLISATSEAEARTGQTFRPDATRHARYKALLDTQQHLYTQLIGPAA
jgi:gluconokinase